MTLDELIAALERAEGPSRELDGEIVAALNLAPVGWRRGTPEWQSHIWVMPQDQSGAHKFEAPWYTESLDAAMTLVPAGACVLLKMTAANEAAYCAIWRDKDESAHNTGPDYDHIRATPALALCIAALKARKTG